MTIRYKIIFLGCFILIISSLQAFCQLSYQIPFFKTEKSIKNNFLLSDSSKKKKNNENGLYFGANLGFYFANRYNAQYYNGSGMNSVDSVINYPYNHTAIKQALGMDSFALSGLPTKMKYSPAFMIGLFFKYTIHNSAIFIQFNFSKLSAKDAFTISYYDPYNPSIPQYKEESIYGSEQRANIDIGYCYTFNPKEKYRPYFEFGYNLNNTKFNDNKIKIENLEYSIVNPYITYYKFNEGGIGMGAFAGAGIELIFSESISVNPGFDLYYIKAKLGYYDKFKPNYSIFVRAILNGLL